MDQTKDYDYSSAFLEHFSFQIHGSCYCDFDTVLYVVTNYYMMQSIYPPSIPCLAVLLVNSLLVNEIKWAEAFFVSSWLPESRYRDASAFLQFALVRLFKFEMSSLHYYCFPGGTCFVRFCIAAILCR